MKSHACAASCALLLLVSARVAAESVVVASDRGSASAAPDTAMIAERGAFLPLSHAASIVNERAFVTGIAGYDSARKAGSFETAAELRLWGPIAVRGGAVYSNGSGKVRPSLGARVQVLREDVQGVDGTVGIFYRPEGLTEPDGEIESVASFGRHSGRTYVLGCLLFGQDPEGNERDGEVRVSALRPLGARALMGFDSRLRFDLGSNRAKLMLNREPTTLDALLGPLTTVFAGPMALSLQAGGSALRMPNGARTTLGLFVLSGLGTTF